MLYLLVVGLVAGWLTGKIMRGTGYGVIVDTVLGVAGAMLGGLIMYFLGFWGSGLIYSIFVAVLGAVILVVIVRALRRV